MKIIKTVLFGILFFSSIIYVDYRLRNAYKPPRVDWPEEIQAAQPGDKFKILKIEDNTIFLDYSK